MYKIVGVVKITDKQIGVLEIKDPIFRWVSVNYNRDSGKLRLAIEFKEVVATHIRVFPFDIPEGENVDGSKLDLLMLSIPELSGAAKVS